jgi:hypothetical protein
LIRPVEQTIAAFEREARADAPPVGREDVSEIGLE